MIQQYYNVLHVWWSTLLQLAITLPSSLVRRQEDHKLHEDYFEIRKRKEYVGYLYYVRSGVPLMAALQMLWLQTSHLVHLMTGENSMFLI